MDIKKLEIAPNLTKTCHNSHPNNNQGGGIYSNPIDPD